MSLSLTGVGAVQPIHALPGHAPPYAQNRQLTDSIAETIAGAEVGAAAVVYQPSPADAEQNHVYSNREKAMRGTLDSGQHLPDRPRAISGDEAIVAATGGTALPPPSLPQTPHSAEVMRIMTDIWAPMRSGLADPVPTGGGGVSAPIEAGQAEAAALASYAAVADAMIANAPLADVEKFA